MCYPAPYGSATCTSDYDVGLVGKDAGFLTEKFNEYFKVLRGLTNRRSLCLTPMSMLLPLNTPCCFLFVQLPNTFADGVMENEQTINFKMQELASAYYKVFKYNEAFFNALLNRPKVSMTQLAAKSKTQLNVWLNT